MWIEALDVSHAFLWNDGPESVGEAVSGCGTYTATRVAPTDYYCVNRCAHEIAVEACTVECRESILGEYQFILGCQFFHNSSRLSPLINFRIVDSFKRPKSDRSFLKPITVKKLVAISVSLA